MRTQIKNFALALVFALGSVSMTAAAFTPNKAVEKARAAVEKASPDDWQTYAKSAEKCIRREVNLKEAAEWLDKSLSIKETSYNLRVKGDYYKMNNLPEKALEYYIKSIQAGILSDVNYSDPETQQKISEVRQSM